MATEAIAAREPQGLAYRHELTVEDLVAQVEKIHRVLKEVMARDVHYGTIPGTPKPTLYQPGADKLCMLFRLRPDYAIHERWDGEHYHVRSVCDLIHIPTGETWGSGQGSCSSREVKYAYRQARRSCPKCQKEAISKSKEEYGGGWYCNKRAEGCGAKFDKGDRAIEAQEVGRIPNPDLADQYNTVLKMANKRSKNAAVLTATAASDVFTQDVIDEDDDEAGDAAPPRRDNAIISEGQGKRLWAIARGALWSQDDVHAHIAEERYGYKSTNEIKVRHYDAIVDEIKKNPQKAPAA